MVSAYVFQKQITKLFNCALIIYDSLYLQENIIHSITYCLSTNIVLLKSVF